MWFWKKKNSFLYMVILICFSLVFLMVVAGCSGIAEKVIDKTIDKLIEAENEANADNGVTPGFTTPAALVDRQSPASDPGAQHAGSGSVDATDGTQRMGH